MTKLITVLLLLMPVITGCVTPIQAELDEEVKRLCAIDGGIKVYETVKLPPEKFNQYGEIAFFRPTLGENALGAEYLFKRETTYYRRGNPEMSRSHYQIVRRADDKVLGEVIRYGRGGGDIPGPSHGTSFSCPDPHEGPVNALLKSVFLKAH